MPATMHMAGTCVHTKWYRCTYQDLDRSPPLTPPQPRTYKPRAFTHAWPRPPASPPPTRPGGSPLQQAGTSDQPAEPAAASTAAPQGVPQEVLREEPQAAQQQLLGAAEGAAATPRLLDTSPSSFALLINRFTVRACLLVGDADTAPEPRQRESWAPPGAGELKDQARPPSPQVCMGACLASARQSQPLNVDGQARTASTRCLWRSAQRVPRGHGVLPEPLRSLHSFCWTLLRRSLPPGGCRARSRVSASAMLLGSWLV